MTKNPVAWALTAVLGLAVLIACGKDDKVNNWMSRPLQSQTNTAGC